MLKFLNWYAYLVIYLCKLISLIFCLLLGKIGGSNKHTTVDLLIILVSLIEIRFRLD